MLLFTVIIPLPSFKRCFKKDMCSVYHRLIIYYIFISNNMWVHTHTHTWTYKYVPMIWRWIVKIVSLYLVLQSLNRSAHSYQLLAYVFPKKFIHPFTLIHKKHGSRDDEFYFKSREKFFHIPLKTIYVFSKGQCLTQRHESLWGGFQGPLPV